MSDFNVLGTSPIGSDPSKLASYNTVKAPERGVFSQEELTDFPTQNTESIGSEQDLKEKDIGVVVDEVNAFMKNMQHNLSFSIDEESGDPIIFIKDIDTDEVIRQIPSEELVVLRKKLDDVTGILFDTKV